MSHSTLGERLSQLRQQLLWAGPEAGTPERVAQDAQLSVEAVLRLEEIGEGTAAELAALLRFYVEQDANMRWLLLPDNAELPTTLLDDRWHWADFTKAFSQVRSLEKFVQQSVIQILLELTPTLPLDRYTPEELAAYQRDLPPVRATATGWQSRAVDLAPYHYYQAGESVPFCGNVADSLLYDDLSAPVVAEKAKCTSCHKRLTKLAPTAVRPRGRGTTTRQ